MKKIVFILNNLAFGGVQKTVVNFANALHLRNLHVELIVLQDHIPLVNQLNSTIKVTYFGSNNYIKSLWMLRKYLKVIQPYAVFANLFVPNTLTLVAGLSIRNRPKIILGIHNTYSKEILARPFPQSMIEEIIVKYIFPLADGINICSHEAAMDLVNTLKRDFSNLNVIYNPVITPEINSLAAEKNDHPWFQKGKPPVILGIGRITKQKDFATLIRAFRLLNQRVDSRLIILGDGDEKTNLLRLIQIYNLEDKIELMGFVQNPYKFLATASLFVLPSLYEGLPSVLIEANYLGCPIVSTACKSGPKEILLDGKYGTLVPVGNPEEMAKAMEKQLQSNKTKVDAEWAVLFSTSSIVDQYIRLYFQ